MKSITKLIISLVVAYVIVISFILLKFYYFNRVDLNAKIPSSSERTTAFYESLYNDDDDEIVEEEEVVIPTIFEQSIAICRNSYAEEIAIAVRNAAKKYNIYEYIIYAIIVAESGRDVIINDETGQILIDVNKYARSGANCHGLMQLSTYAVQDYNNRFGTHYKLDDVTDIGVNIDIGTWHYARYAKFEQNAVALYAIYNVGYTEFTTINNNWFFDEHGKWKNNYRNSYFYMNEMYPPTAENSYTRGVYGQNKLNDYKPVRRFKNCLNICYKHFYG